MTAKLALTAVLMLSFSIPALAMYKCEDGGRISYSDTACATGGKEIGIALPPPADAAGANRRLAQEKSELKRLENDRHKREAQEEKEQLRVANAMASRKKKCDTLARRVKWAQEDAALATGRPADKAKRKARRMSEQYDGECAK